MKINIGAVQISDWREKCKKKKMMFSYDFYYDEKDEYFNEEYAKEVEDCPPNEVILPANKEYTLIIDYPVSVPYKVKFKTKSKGITRLQFADLVCREYHKMYKEEDKTSGGDPGHIAGMYNRERSEGKYGIWGHDIGDLVLVNAEVKGRTISLGVDS